MEARRGRRAGRARARARHVLGASEPRSCFMKKVGAGLMVAAAVLALGAAPARADIVAVYLGGDGGLTHPPPGGPHPRGNAPPPGPRLEPGGRPPVFPRHARRPAVLQGGGGAPP